LVGKPKVRRNPFSFSRYIFRGKKYVNISPMELSTGRYERSEILPFGPPTSLGCRLKSLHARTPLWITPEKSSITYFSNKAKNLIYTYFFVISARRESVAQRVLLGAEKTRGKVGDGHEGIYF
jgi:hypothetical protein